LNWSKAGSVAGAILFVILIVGITVGARGCSNEDYPFLCMVAQLFHR
jgi:hypothetical protein